MTTPPSDETAPQDDPRDDAQDGVPSEAPELRAEQIAPATPASELPSEAPRRLYRSKADSWFGGVAGGMAEHFDIDPTLVRIGFVVLAIVTSGLGVLAYLGAWILIPERPGGGPADASRGGGNTAGLVWGFILVMVGLVFLLAQLDLDLDFSLWEVTAAGALTLVGLFMAVEARRGLNGGLLALALILTTVLGLSRVADFNFEIDGAFGDSRVEVHSVDDLESTYSYAFGQLTIDLRNLDVPVGETVEVAVNVLFGKAHVLLPDGIPARLEGTAVFGSVEGNNVQTGGVVTSRDYTPPGWAEADRRLDVRISSVFGSGEVN